MKIGIVSDAHGNRLGLLACLKFLVREGVEELYFLGDAVGYMPDWKGVFESLDNYNVVCLRGNHDQMAIDDLELPLKHRAYGITRKLKAENAQFLSWAATWPTSISKEISSKKIMFVHGSPWQKLNGYVYPDSDMQRFATVDADVVFMGNTHRPFVKNINGKIVVNVGSCGLPRDAGNLLSCAIYDISSNNCMIYRIPHDVENVISLFGDDLHSTVIDCLRRHDDNYYGVLVDI
jgi:putative phosphoesterase